MAHCQPITFAHQHSCCDSTGSSPCQRACQGLDKPGQARAVATAMAVHRAIYCSHTIVPREAGRAATSTMWSLKPARMEPSQALPYNRQVSVSTAEEHTCSATLLLSHRLFVPTCFLSEFVGLHIGALQQAAVRITFLSSARLEWLTSRPTTPNRCVTPCI